jgi:type II secretory pathway component PulJ
MVLRPPFYRIVPPAGAARGFTLVEVILAIGLATAMLLVALVFYHQAAEMRENLMRESEAFTGMRLTLDRLAADLRAAQPTVNSNNLFMGDSSSMQFVKESLGVPTAAGDTNAVEAPDLMKVTFTALVNTNGTNSALIGLDRNEESLYSFDITNALPVSTNQLTLSTNDPSLMVPDQTNVVVEPFADMVRFVRFRYWDGSAWQASWTNAAPPPGVEIVLAATTLPDDAAPDALPPDAFRRVIYLPGGVAQPQTDPTVSTNYVSQ